MRILIVCSANSGRIAPFVSEQGGALKEQDCIVDYFPIYGKGITGYLSNLSKLKKQLSENAYDLVHAHYGLCGALSIMQRKVPVVITFHNGETLTRKANLLSSVASLFSSYNIYVAQHIYDLCFFKRKKNFLILPCGIPLNQIQIMHKKEAMEKMNLSSNKINILFGGAFNNLRKNVDLANKALAILNRNDINLIELKGFNREQVITLLNACDLMLLPTKSEGSPQIVKEAMACNCPIVATPVADIPLLIKNTEGCYLTTFSPEDVAEKIKMAISYGKRTTGRKIMENYDNSIIAQRIINEVYNKILKS